MIVKMVEFAADGDYEGRISIPIDKIVAVIEVKLNDGDVCVIHMGTTQQPVKESYSEVIKKVMGK